MNGIDIKKFLNYLFALYHVDSGETELYRTWVQKILWFTHWKFYRLYNEPFFSDDFESYKYGPVSWTVLKTQFFSLQTPKNTSYNLEDILDYHRNDIIDEFKDILKNDFLKDFSHDYGETFTEEQKIEAQEKRWDCFLFVFERLKKMRPNELMNLSYKQKSYKTALSNPTSKIILNETILEDSEIDVLKNDF
ncbi:Panacea domain-containing protein [Mesomycoplasma ovipneumoniae]